MAEHSLHLTPDGRYVRAECSCGWRAEQRRAASPRATIDGSQHAGLFHLTHLLQSPTIWTWTEECGACSCGWQGEWHQAPDSLQWACSDASAHRVGALTEAWSPLR